MTGLPLCLSCHELEIDDDLFYSLAYVPVCVYLEGKQNKSGRENEPTGPHKKNLPVYSM